MLHSGRAADSGLRTGLHGDTAGCIGHRMRFGCLPPRGITGSAAGFRRKKEPGTIDIPGRRERWKCNRTSAGSSDSPALRSACRELDGSGSDARIHHSGQNRSMVQPAAGTEKGKGQADTCCLIRAAEEDGTHRPGHTGADAFLEIFLQRLHDELFHILSHREIRSFHPALPALPVRISGGFRDRHPGRRLPRRPLRQEICDPVLDSRGSTVHPGHAISESWLGHLHGRDERTGDSIRILCDISVRHGPDAGQARDDFRNVFRTDVRSGRHRIGIFRLACR